MHVLPNAIAEQPAQRRSREAPSSSRSARAICSALRKSVLSPLCPLPPTAHWPGSLSFRLSFKCETPGAAIMRPSSEPALRFWRQEELLGRARGKGRANLEGLFSSNTVAVGHSALRVLDRICEKLFLHRFGRYRKRPLVCPVRIDSGGKTLKILHTPRVEPTSPLFARRPNQQQSTNNRRHNSDSDGCQDQLTRGYPNH
jgi:hypothetical protein